MSRLIRKSHNVSILIYNIVCPAKYRRVVFTVEVDKELKAVCLEIAKRYEKIKTNIGLNDRVEGHSVRAIISKQQVPV
jgi:putative transposase